MTVSAKTDPKTPSSRRSKRRGPKRRGPMGQQLQHNTPRSGRHSERRPAAPAEGHTEPGPASRGASPANQLDVRRSPSRERSSDRPSTGFERFRLHPALVRAAQATGFEEPRPIQLATIPAGLDGRDVLGLAQTGTGKTAAFALPLLHHLLEERRPGPRALVIAPTRELALQIEADMRTLAQFTRLRSVTLIGGVSMHRQIQSLRRHPEIVVGCPGRVLDLHRQGILRLDHIETLVLDEADHMFDMGFLPDVRRILGALPAKRRNLLFSATMPHQVRGLANEVLDDPHVVELANASPVATIDHALIHVDESRKRELLEQVLTGEDCESAIVFTRTKHRARRLAEQLSKAGHRAIGLQGNMSQPQRDRAMGGFRARRFDVLVATDIAARGIDVSNVSYVINFDAPNTPEAYTHRIGRTGRAEREGRARTFVTRGDEAWLRATERSLGKRIPCCRVEGFEREESSPRRRAPWREQERGRSAPPRAHVPSESRARGRARVRRP